MYRPARKLALATVLALAAASAQALDFRSLAEPAILYETPSAQGRKLFIAAAGTPVEVVVELEQWLKVREPGGAILWVARSAVQDQHTVLITASPSAIVRQSADAQSAVSFEASTNVVLERVAPAQNGWIQVRHRNGASGYVRLTDVWGR